MLFVSRRLVDSVVKNDSSSKANWGPERTQGKAVGECFEFFLLCFDKVFNHFNEKSNVTSISVKPSLFMMYQTSMLADVPSCS